MPKLLSTDYLNDPKAYAQAESIWRDRWTQMLRELGQQDAWESPWLNAAFADGTPFQDGNPIFSAICPSRRLGVRVIQVALDCESELATWTDTTMGPDEVQELVINCPLTEEYLDQSIQLMRTWITQQS